MGNATLGKIIAHFFQQAAAAYAGYEVGAALNSGNAKTPQKVIIIQPTIPSPKEDKTNMILLLIIIAILVTILLLWIGVIIYKAIGKKTVKKDEESA